MNPFDLLNTPIQGINLIEAGAGTGKTYTIAGVYLKLILEYHRTPEEILVVTFTQSATDELKDRIRRQLYLAKTAIQEGSCGDVTIDGMIAAAQKKGHDSPQLYNRVQLGLNNFDLAAITTIHGFCHSVLKEYAYETANLFDTELLTDQTQLVLAVADDFWRAHFYSAPPEWLNYALPKIRGPETLMQLYHRCGHPNVSKVQIYPEANHGGLPSLAMYREVYQDLKAAWNQERDNVLQLLKSPAIKSNVYGSLQPLNGSTKREFKLLQLAALMDQLNDPVSIGFPLFKGFELFSQSKIQASTKKNQAVPDHSFFKLCERLKMFEVVLEEEMAHRLASLKTEFIGYTAKELAQRKALQNVQFYDDLLLKVSHILEDESGDFLIKTMRQKYKVALVDEFQDTDDLQYGIFSRLFGGEKGQLFMIGDPKQAIYGFRGADIFSYLKAARQTDAEYTLTTNWRSEPRLIEAVNSLFQFRNKPFVLDAIRFEKAIPQKTTANQTAPENPSPVPLVLWYLSSEKLDPTGKPISKAKAVPRIAAAVADEILRLLHSGRGRDQGRNNSPFKPDDIAVLVRTNRQAGIIKQTLYEKGIPAVLHQAGNIFDSVEAIELKRLLVAVADPSDPVRLRTALTTPFFSIESSQIDVFCIDSLQLNDCLTRLYRYHSDWKRKGFLYMFQMMLSEEDVRERLLEQWDGERKLTNFLHLSELLQQACLQEQLTMAGLTRWLSNQCNPDAPRLDEDLLRLESDKQAINIVTVHKSKGLEYPVVFCPFAWEGMPAKNDPLIFHDPAQDWKLSMDVGSQKIKENEPLAQMEMLAESIRLLYVALTRAKEKCYLVWGRINSGETSPLAYLIHDRSEINRDLVASLKRLFSKKRDAELKRDLSALAEQSKGAIFISDLPEPDSFTKPVPSKGISKLTCPTFSGDISANWKITSFTGMVMNRETEDANLGHDSLSEDAWQLPDMSTHEAYSGKERNIFSFPKGVRAGNFFHEILEAIDFRSYRDHDFSEMISEKLTVYGFEVKWLDTVRMTIDRILSTPLLPNDMRLQLSAVPMNQRVSEMAFYFPIQFLGSKTLGELIPGYETDKNNRLQGIKNKSFVGYMKGFIDLVFRFAGQYFIVDWKSNYLGSTIQDYDQTAIKSAIEKEYYTLQYHLYALALHKYLTHRLADYHYQEHFGGVFYLFIRGIDPVYGPEYGVYHDIPEMGRIQSLEEALRRIEEEK